MNKKNGYTLVEFVIVIAVLGIIAVTIAPILISGFNAFFTAQSLTTAVAQAQISFAMMQRDIHEIRSPSDISAANATSLAFILMGNSSTTYSLSSTTNALSAITYSLNGTTLLRNGQILATSIGGLSFSYFSSTGAAVTAVTAIRDVGISLNVKTPYANMILWTVINGRDLLP